MGKGIKSSLEIDRSQDITLAKGVEMASIKLGIVGLGLGQWMVETVKKIEDAKVVVADENMPARLEWASQRVLCPSFPTGGRAVIKFTSVAPPR